MSQPDNRLRSAGASLRRATQHRPVPTAELATAHQRRRQAITLRTAIAVLVLGPLVAIAVVAMGGDDGSGGDVAGYAEGTPAAPGGTVAPAAPAVQWHTQNVRFGADAVTVVLPDANFTGEDPAAVVDGDPGTAEYTTLERTWQEHGVEMRFNVYFHSDGTEWWADEIRVYDGNPEGEWVTFTGELLRAPLGQRHRGDLTLDGVTAAGLPVTLSMTGLEVQAFARPDCPPTMSTTTTLVGDLPTVGDSC